MKFYKLTPEKILDLHSVLTDKQIILFLYLKAQNPFSNQYQKIKTSAIAELFNISVRTVQKAIKRFKELQLIDYRITEFEYTIIEPYNANLEDTEANLDSHSTNLEDTEANLDSHSTNTDSLKNLESQLGQDLQVSQDLKNNKNIKSFQNTNTKTQHKNINDEDEKEDKLSRNVSIEPLVTEITEIKNAIADSLSEKEEQTFRDCSIEENNQIQDEEQERVEIVNLSSLEIAKNPDFQEWLARKWKVKYGDITSMAEAIANVKAHFINQPEKIMIRWEEYQAERQQRVEAKNLLLNNYQSMESARGKGQRAKDDNQDGNIHNSSLSIQNCSVYSDGNRTVKMNDYTGYHQKLQEEKPNPKVTEMMKLYLEQLKMKGGRKS